MGFTGSWEMKSQVPPLAFFLEVGSGSGVGFMGWEKMDMRPEQELVVKYEGWELRVMRRGMMGVSMVPLGDLSGSGEFMEAKVAAFLLWNSIVARSFCLVSTQKKNLIWGQDLNLLR